MERVSVRVASPPMSSVGSGSWNRVKNALGKLISASSVMKILWIFPTSLMMVNRSRVVS